MQVKIKKLYNDAKLPTRAHYDDAGWDLYAHSCIRDDEGNIVYGVGVAFEIPQGYVGLVIPRSSNASRDLILSNSIGVIDSGYRGEVSFKFKIFYPYDEHIGLFLHNMTNDYEIGDRIGQIIIIPYPEIEFVETDELSESERGTTGYGGSGR